ncbi:MAG: isoprenylcysteine carboxylmethyltransferase family protein [Tissierellia bacterium]|nr:isoprenylcysteine carboxylmethyltransferase family protein [Tissierellia bacterium]
MKSREHLPVLGVGPIYVGIISGMTALIFYLQKNNKIPVTPFGFQPLFKILAGLIILIGVSLWLGAVVHDRVGTKIKENQLVTDGVYAYCRNPIYTAFLFLNGGLLLLMNNLYIFPFFFLYWLFLSLFMQKTEEKWLKEKFGEEYLMYEKKVPRCIPKFPRK